MRKYLPFDLSEDEILTIAKHFQICNKLKRVKIIENLKEYLTNKMPDEFGSAEHQFLENEFFNKYSGKECHVYKYMNHPSDEDWFILEDNNVPIDVNCFIDLSDD